jgi:hydroxyethylthiazole kinase-like uncharacterized protein yjeF
MHKKQAHLASLPRNALLTAADMAAVDAAAAQGFAGGTFDLMLHAAHALMDVVLACHAEARRIAILCGPGNNGGDGLVLATLLAARGVAADVFAMPIASPRAEPITDAARALALWHTRGGRVEPMAAFQAQGFDLVVDALFGAGFTRPLDAEAARAAVACRDAGVAVLAVDLPSGVSGDTGFAAGTCFAARTTVTFHRKKPGHVLLPGRHLCGELIVADIGIRLRSVLPGLVRNFENTPDLWRAGLPSHAVGTHKYARGAVGVVTGGTLNTGAARLAAAAAQRAGAGAVTLLGPDEALPVLAAHATSAMISRCGTGAELGRFLAAGKTAALVLGPALGIDARAQELFEAAMQPAQGLMGLVLDADMLTVMARHAEAAFGRIAASGTPVVLTPHDGEFARLFPGLAGLPKLERARRAAASSGAVVLLKGADTVIAAPDGRAAVNTNGTIALATAGSGDVLAGIIAALTAQGMPAWEAACAGAWLHAEAGRDADAGGGAEAIASAVNMTKSLDVRGEYD